jgi:hypothetical protein
VPAEYEPGKTKLPEDAKLAEGIMADHFNRIATRDGKQYYASKPDALFIMMKLDPATAGTDDGWVYATTSADGKTVTAAGKIESCMKCHVEAKNNRLFGLGGK